MLLVVSGWWFSYLLLYKKNILFHELVNENRLERSKLFNFLIAC